MHVSLSRFSDRVYTGGLYIKSCHCHRYNDNETSARDNSLRIMVSYHTCLKFLEN
jgi:hypothetical protein